MKKSYFFIASLVLLFLSFLGFSDNLFTDVNQESNSDPKFIVHGLFCFAWFIFLFLQTFYIRRRNYSAHKKWGMAGILIATGVFLSTLYVFVAVYENWGNMFYTVKANRFFMVGYAAMITLAYLKRKRADHHKRYMLIGTLYMLGPILSRAMAHSFLDAMIPNPLTWDILFIVIWTLCFISLFVYDWLTIKKIHRVTYLGFGIYTAIWALSILL